MRGLDLRRRKAARLQRALVERLYGARRAEQLWTEHGFRSKRSHNIVGLGYGTKHCNGEAVAGITAVRVYVRKKFPRSKVTAKELIPREIMGVPTDVIEVTRARALGLAAPIACGTPIGIQDGETGTLGCLLRSVSGSVVLLSNNHILANWNKAPFGSPIYQVAAPGGGTMQIAALADFEPVHIDSGNLMDAAIGEVLDPGSVSPEVAGIGRVVGPPLLPQQDMRVRKSGCCGLTWGVIRGLHEHRQIWYRGQWAMFNDLLVIQGENGRFAKSSDSGALVVDSLSTRAIGLVFAADNEFAYASYLEPVLARFSARII